MRLIEAGDWAALAFFVLLVICLFGSLLRGRP